MPERTAVSARCEDCAKIYRIPNPDRAYRCKACGGTVRAVPVDVPHEGPVIKGMITCTECGALNPSGAHFCDECGAVLGHWATVSTREEEDELRRDANAALRSAYQTIGGVKWLWRLGALAYAIAMAFAIGALARTDVPLGGGIVVVLLTTLLSVMMLMAAMGILFHPFAWTVAIAALATVVSIVHWVGPNPYGLAVLGSALWAVAAWGALAPTYRFHKLIDEHTDLYILHHASKRTRRSLTGKFAKERHERLVAAMHRAARRAWRTSSLAAAALCLVAALGTFAVVSNLRPQRFEEALVAFEAAWNDAGVPGVERFFDRGVRSAEMLKLPGLLEGHGWGERPPALADGDVRREEVRAWVDYDLAGVPLEASWVLNDLTWRVARLKLPVPPFDPVLERFLDAWRSSDAKAIGTFFSAENQRVMSMTIGASARERGWETFPAIEETELRGDPTRGDVIVVLDLEKGKCRTEWRLRADGTWGLINLKFPRRWKTPDQDGRPVGGDR